MSEARKGDKFVAALVPYDPITLDSRRAVPMDSDTSKAEQQTFYRSLLEIPWLAPRIRRAVATEMGVSLREHNAKIERAKTATMRVMIAEAEARMKKRPRGGAREATVEKVADMVGLSVEALKRRLAPSRSRAAKKELGGS